jgi:hypothetical protein
MDLDRVFDFHPPRDEGVGNLHQEVRSRCKDLAAHLKSVLPECDEKNEALLFLDFAMTRANAAIARELST